MLRRCHLSCKHHVRVGNRIQHDCTVALTLPMHHGCSFKRRTAKHEMISDKVSGGLTNWGGKQEDLLLVTVAFTNPRLKDCFDLSVSFFPSHFHLEHTIPVTSLSFHPAFSHISLCGSSHTPSCFELLPSHQLENAVPVPRFTLRAPSFVAQFW